MAGYRKGSQTVGRNLTFTINERTAHYYFLSGEHCSKVHVLWLCIIVKTTEGSPDIMVLTTEVRINPQLQPQEVEVIFQTDGIAQEGNVTVILELEPLLTTTLPMGEAVFFQKYIDMIIIDTDSENV